MGRKTKVDSRESGIILFVRGGGYAKFFSSCISRFAGYEPLHRASSCVYWFVDWIDLANWDVSGSDY